MMSLAIYHLVPIPLLGVVEMWQVLGRSDLRDLLRKLRVSKEQEGHREN